MTAPEKPVVQDLPEEPSYAVMEKAAQWFALLRSGDATKRDHEQWQSWLNSHEEHQRAWQFVGMISQRFGDIQSSPAPHDAAKAYLNANTKRLHRRHVLASAMAFAGTGMLGWWTWHHTPVSGIALAVLSDYQTATGDVREIVLPDNTRIWLNTASAMNVDYQVGLRRVQLVRGEMLIETATDPMRAFVVDTVHGRLRALGTRFTVMQDHNTTQLTVFSGAVEITTRQGVRRIVMAGQQSGFDAQSIDVAGVADAARESWTRGILLAKDITLGEFIKELRRYRHGYLGVAPEIAGLRVFGSYSVTDPERTLGMLADVLPVQIKKTFPWWITVEATSDAQGNADRLAPHK